MELWAILLRLVGGTLVVWLILVVALWIARPDRFTVLGIADDAIAVALVLRSIVRKAGPGVIEHHWPGTPEGLAAIRKLAGVTS